MISEQELVERLTPVLGAQAAKELAAVLVEWREDLMHDLLKPEPSEPRGGVRESATVPVADRPAG